MALIRDLKVSTYSNITIHMSLTSQCHSVCVHIYIYIHMLKYVRKHKYMLYSLCMTRLRELIAHLRSAH